MNPFRIRPLLGLGLGFVSLLATTAWGTDAGIQPTPIIAEEHKDIRFWIDAQDVSRPNCGGCARPTWIHIGSYRLNIRGLDGMRFERLDVEGGGRIIFKGITPNGRTVHAKLQPGSEPGHHRVTAFFRSKKGALYKKTQHYRVRKRHRGHDCEVSPCSTPGRQESGISGRDLSAGPKAPPLPCRLPSRGPLRFTTAPGGHVVHGAWPQALLFYVALSDKERGVFGPVADGGPTTPPPPEVACTTGEVLSVESAPDLKGTRDRFQVRVSSVSSDDPEKRLKGGRHSCTVTYPLHLGTRIRKRKGTVTFRISEDGHMTTRKPRCSLPPKPAKTSKKTRSGDQKTPAKGPDRPPTLR
jgi:hypothetical protein